MCHFTKIRGWIRKKKETRISGAIIRQVSCRSFGELIIWRLHLHRDYCNEHGRGTHEMHTGEGAFYKTSSPPKFVALSDQEMGEKEKKTRLPAMIKLYNF